MSTELKAVQDVHLPRTPEKPPPSQDLYEYDASPPEDAGNWKPFDPRLKSRVNGNFYVPDRVYRPLNEAPEERVQRIWERLLCSRGNHSGPHASSYADRFSKSAAVRGVTPLDLVEEVMSRFKRGAEGTGMKLSDPGVELKPDVPVNVS